MPDNRPNNEELAEYLKRIGEKLKGGIQENFFKHLEDVLWKLTEAGEDALKAGFDQYRKEDPHECNLLNNRISSHLTSQSLFLMPYFLLMASQSFGDVFCNSMLTILAAFALVLCWLQMRGIQAGLRISDRWHYYGMGILAAIRGLEKPASIENLARHLPGRVRLPDPEHVESMNRPARWIPRAFLCLWSLLMLAPWCFKLGVMLQFWEK